MEWVGKGIGVLGVVGLDYIAILIVMEWVGKAELDARYNDAVAHRNPYRNGMGWKSHV